MGYCQDNFHQKSYDCLICPSYKNCLSQFYDIDSNKLPWGMHFVDPRDELRKPNFDSKIPKTKKLYQ